MSVSISNLVTGQRSAVVQPSLSLCRGIAEARVLVVAQLCRVLNWEQFVSNREELRLESCHGNGNSFFRRPPFTASSLTIRQLL
jgi:hypothetical protein